MLPLIRSRMQSARPGPGCIRGGALRLGESFWNQVNHSLVARSSEHYGCWLSTSTTRTKTLVLSPRFRGVASAPRLAATPRRMPLRRRQVVASWRPKYVSPRSPQDSSSSSSLSTSTSHPNALLSESTVLPVSAIHIAQTIDLFPALSEILARFSPIRKQTFNKNSFIVELPSENKVTTSTGLNNDNSNSSNNTFAPLSKNNTNNNSPRYVAVFRFGSVVGVNLSPRDLARIVEDIKKKHSVDPVLAGFERKENYSILLRKPPTSVIDGDGDDGTFEGTISEERVGDESGDESSNPTSSAITATSVAGDHCIVPELDLLGVSVISQIMAQTVALDAYNDIVDDLLANFAKMNADVSKTGKLISSSRSFNQDFLFKSVAQNHIIFNDMISKIRIKDRSDTAWNLPKYESIHYGLKKEFEIDDRFDHIEFKLNLIQQNAQFFVEVMQSEKSNFLEWIIVALIAIEGVIMTIEVTGMGEALIEPMLEQYWDFFRPPASPPAS